MLKKAFDFNDLIRTRLVSGLERKLTEDPIEWAKRRINIKGKPLSFLEYPWLAEVLRCNPRSKVTLKGAQLGFTTIEMVETMFTLDIRRTSVLYLLPTLRPDALEFSSTKLATLIHDSPYLQGLFTDVSNVTVKKVGDVVLFIRGANSTNALKSISVGNIKYDEFDEMPYENISLAEERMSGHKEKHSTKLSTPTLPGIGIDKEFQTTTKEYFFFESPCCSTSVADAAGNVTQRPKLVQLEPEQFVLVGDSLSDPNLKKSYIQIPCCGRPLANDEKMHLLARTGRYVPSAPEADPDNRGFSVSQLYSSTIDAYDIARLAIRAQSNPADEQELNNSKWARAHKTKGASVEDAQIDACLGNYCSPCRPNEYPYDSPWITMGIDVGANCNHYVIRQFWFKEFTRDINLIARSAVLAFGRTKYDSEIHDLMRQFQVRFAVIDAQPERRYALQFARCFPGHVRTCYYNTQASSHTLLPASDESNEWKLNADRTFWFDTCLGAIRGGRVTLPRDIDNEFRSHLKAVTRIYKTKVVAAKGKKHAEAQTLTPERFAMYISTGADHYAHAFNYSEMALPLGLGHSTGRDINLFL